MTSEDLVFLAEIASMYYEDELSQSEIGRRIGRSRSMVSRLLREAREQGLVEINIRHPLKRDMPLEDALKEKFSLRAVKVLADPPQDYAQLLTNLGKLGAQTLQDHLGDGICVGVGWGTAVYEVVRALPARELQRATVVQMIGALGSGDPMVDGPELAQWLAQKLSATYRFLHAPLIVEEPVVARSLCQQKSIATTLEMAAKADIALVGVGTVASEHSSLRRAGYLDDDDLAQLQQGGAVGDILARQIDSRGRPLKVDINQRVIGLGLETLRTIPNVLAVAGGPAKQTAILAALHGGHINTLVTDAGNAKAILLS
jgi:DNA-binding transcriptional regulator LsrR (DeoR family)